MQQSAHRRPELHGQGSFGPSSSVEATLWPCTTRSPPLTFVSDGYPRRRLRVRAKPLLRPEVVVHARHHTPLAPAYHAAAADPSAKEALTFGGAAPSARRISEWAARTRG